MKATALCAALIFLCVGAALAQTPPQISEVFSSAIDLYLSDRHQNLTGHGTWAANQPAGKSVEVFHFGADHPENEERLARYDLHKGYDVYGSIACQEIPLEGEMPSFWSWVKDAKFSRISIQGQQYDAWTVKLGYAQVTLAVDKNQNPAWFIRQAEKRSISIRFVNWTSEAPSDDVFAVPSKCSHHEGNEVGCVGRSTMISRAQVWVTKHIPYSQSNTYEGYRTDCSGYVSMAWETSKPGYTTYTLPHISHPISKGELQPGDVLLCTSEHVVLFGGWANSAKTQYVAYEETRPGEGTVKRATPYPYWYNTGCFKPYRYNSAC